MLTFLMLRSLPLFFEFKGEKKTPEHINYKELQEFTKWIVELGLAPYTQARIISGIKAFYNYLELGGNDFGQSNSAVRSSKTRPKTT